MSTPASSHTACIFTYAQAHIQLYINDINLYEFMNILLLVLRRELFRRKPKSRDEFLRAGLKYIYIYMYIYKYIYELIYIYNEYIITGPATRAVPTKAEKSRRVSARMAWVCRIRTRRVESRR